MSNPDATLAKCTRTLDHRRISIKANGRVAIFLNPDETHIRQVDVDCWLGSTPSCKADYILIKPRVVDVIVELKGKEIDHAIEQILATLALWKAVPSRSPRIGGLVIFTRSPKRSAKLDAVKLRLLEKHDIWLEMGKSGLREYEFEIFTETRK